MEKIKELIDSIVKERCCFLHTKEGLDYLLKKYPKDCSFDEVISRELISIYDEINSVVYLYITGRIVELRND